MGGLNQNSSSSSSSQRSRKRYVYCDCGVRSPLITSWTDDNFGRKFFGCGLYEVYGKKCCGFFQWYDDDDCAAKDKIITGLVKKNEEMKKKNGEMKKKNEEMKNKIQLMENKQCVLMFLLAVSLVLVILLLIAYVTK